MSFMNEAEREALRQDIERHTQAFLRKGGKVIEVPHGISGINTSNGLLTFKIKSTEQPQPRNPNTGLFAESTKKRGRPRKIDKPTTAVAGDGTTIDEDLLDDNDDGGTP
jgi:hypothetical protein